jgi:hypothetical protein
MRVSEARQRLSQVGQWIAAVESDREQAADRERQAKSRIVFVFDTDVITMYSNPDLGSQYCAMLRSADSAREDKQHVRGKGQSAIRRSEISLADILGNHFVWGRGDDLALTTPAHAEELKDVVEAVFLKAMTDIPPLEDHLRSKFGALVDRPQSEEDVAATGQSFLAKAIDDIFRAAAKEFPEINRALRLDAAFNRQRITSLEFFSEHEPENQEAQYLPSALDAQTGDVIDEIRALAKHLERILVSGNSYGQRKLERFRVDAEALAHLCWLNLQLEGSQRATRVRFVTGAPHLHQLCESESVWKKRLPAALFDKFREWSPALQELIRHPIGFVDDPQVQALIGLGGADAVGDGKLGVWLRDKVNGAADASADRPDSMVDDAASELSTLLTEAHARQSISPDSAWIASVVYDLVSAKHESWDELLENRVRDLYPTFLASLAALQAPRHEEHRVARNLPPLTFSSFTKCQQFCDELYRQLPRQKNFASTIKAALTEVIASDRTLYTPLIAIALWRAAERSWSHSRAMAEAAVEVANRHVEQRTLGSTAVDEQSSEAQHIYGEEAYFLLAVATRITAGKDRRKTGALSDLKLAAEHLAKSRTRLEDFLKTRSEIPPAPFRRHDAEAISLAVTRLLYAKLARVEPSEPIDEPKVFDDGWRIISEAAADLDSTTRSRYEVEFVIQQVSVALLQLVLLDRYRMFSQEVFPVREDTWSEQAASMTTVNQVWKMFDEQCNRLVGVHNTTAEVSMPVVSTLVDGVWRVFGIEHNGAHRLKSGERSSQRRLLQTCFAEDQIVATIDDLRFNFLLKIGERHLGLA